MRLYTLFVRFFWAAFLTLTMAQNIPPTPCPDVFQYNYDGTQTTGVITAINPPPYGSVMLLKVVLSLGASLPSQHSARIEPYYDNAAVLQSIRQGGPIYYKVYFPFTYPLPYVVSVEFDNNIICSGPPTTGSYITTTLTLSHTFRSGSAYTGGNTNNIIPPPRRTMRPQTFNPPEISTTFYRPPEESPPSPPRRTTTTRATTTRTTTLRTQLSSFDEGFSYVSCGIPEEKQTVGLINGGEVANREDWPWLVALFRRSGSSGNIRKEFKCGASLVSERLVITAAHCVTTSTGRAYQPFQFLLKIGAYDIDDEADEFSLVRTPSRIVVRDDYNPNTFTNDITVLVLTTVVTFSKYIKPVCLWDSSDNEDQIVDVRGKVVGWGRDELGVSVTPEPKAVEVPIVSSLTCKTSNSILYDRVTNTTLCAGSRDNTGPCNGDSGGGLYIKRGRKWYLRGIVSSSLKREQDSYCNLAEYVIYTDVAKFGSWINSIF